MFNMRKRLKKKRKQKNTRFGVAAFHNWTVSIQPLKPLNNHLLSGRFIAQLCLNQHESYATLLHGSLSSLLTSAVLLSVQLNVLQFAMDETIQRKGKFPFN